jgi:hypothetical protein
MGSRKELIGMRKLWLDVAHHRSAAALFLAYWLATLAVVPLTSHGGIPISVVALLLTNSFIAGALIGWWRGPTSERIPSSRERTLAGTLAGLLTSEITFILMAGEELFSWMHGGHFQGVEVLGFAVALGLVGAIFGLAGAMCSVVLHHPVPAK